MPSLEELTLFKNHISSFVSYRSRIVLNCQRLKVVFVIPIVFVDNVVRAPACQLTFSESIDLTIGIKVLDGSEIRASERNAEAYLANSRLNLKDGFEAAGIELDASKHSPPKHRVCLNGYLFPNDGSCDGNSYSSSRTFWAVHASG